MALKTVTQHGKYAVEDSDTTAVAGKEEMEEVQGYDALACWNRGGGGGKEGGAYSKQLPNTQPHQNPQQQNLGHDNAECGEDVFSTFYDFFSTSTTTPDKDIMGRIKTKRHKGISEKSVGQEGMITEVVQAKKHQDITSTATQNNLPDALGEGVTKKQVEMFDIV